MLTKLTKTQKLSIAEKIMEWGNLVFVGLVLVQFAPEAKNIRLDLVILGAVGLLGAYLLAYVIMIRR